MDKMGRKAWCQRNKLYRIYTLQVLYPVAFTEGICSNQHISHISLAALLKWPKSNTQY